MADFLSSNQGSCGGSKRGLIGRRNTDWGIYWSLATDNHLLSPVVWDRQIRVSSRYWSRISQPPD